MDRSRVALDVGSEEGEHSPKKRRDGIAVKCEQFRRLFGAEISLTINIPSASGPDVYFAYFSNPEHARRSTVPAGQHRISTILQPDSFEDVPDSKGSSTVDNSVKPRAKAPKIRIKPVTREERARIVPTNAPGEGLTERSTSKQPASRAVDSTLLPRLHNPSSQHHINLPGFEVIDRLSRENLANCSIPAILRLPNLDPSTKTSFGA